MLHKTTASTTAKKSNKNFDKPTEKKTGVGKEIKNKQDKCKCHTRSKQIKDS